MLLSNPSQAVEIAMALVRVNKIRRILPHKNIKIVNANTLLGSYVPPSWIRELERHATRFSK